MPEVVVLFMIDKLKLDNVRLSQNEPNTLVKINT